MQTTENCMHWYHSEPTLPELLSDPIVNAVMAADRVTPADVAAELSRIAAKLPHRETSRPRFASIPARHSVSPDHCI